MLKKIILLFTMLTANFFIDCAEVAQETVRQSKCMTVTNFLKKLPKKFSELLKITGNGFSVGMVKGALDTMHENFQRSLNETGESFLKAMMQNPDLFHVNPAIYAPIQHPPVPTLQETLSAELIEQLINQPDSYLEFDFDVLPSDVQEIMKKQLLSKFNRQVYFHPNSYKIVNKLSVRQLIGMIIINSHWNSKEGIQKICQALSKNDSEEIADKFIRSFATLAEILLADYDGSVSNNFDYGSQWPMSPVCACA